jgi:glycosyltransferase involved in cell wall biosynthesis
MPEPPAMKIDKIAGKECLSPKKVGSTAKNPIVLFADFLPTETDVSLAASDLVVAAQASGAKITSATFASESFAQISLSCRTPMHFQRAKERFAQMQLPAAAHVVVLLESFIRAEMQSTTRFRRIKERRRILFLLAEILRIRPDAILVASGSVAHSYLAAVRALGRLGAPVVRPVCDLLNGSLARDIGLIQPARLPERRLALLERHSGLALGLRRLTVQTMLSQAGTSGHEEDLRFLIKIASSAALRSHPTIRWLRTAAPGHSYVHECPGPHRSLQTAQEPAPQAERFNLPITRYMMHLHAVLQLEREFPLTTKSQAQTYLDWYRKRCFERVPSRWVPCPPITEKKRGSASGRAGTGAEGAEQIVLDLLGSALPQGNADTEMMAYLAGNPVGISPPRLAIILATLCQIPIRLQNDRPVWTSQDIRKWFEEIACRLIPDCRGFAPASNPPVKPVKTLTIYGMTGGKTGLGANTVMACGMAEEMGVPFAVRDVEGAEHALQPLAGAGSRTELKRNIALHHVNADRIPLQIMSPELARRNDTYHIGFLLWELDRIPQAHKLGLSLLDEIWAPSRFVADLYATQTSKPVHLVKKGLVDLQGLQKLSAVQNSDPSRFTVLICFDFHSSIERKNPLAAVRAFQIAFPRHSHADCRLIVKTTPTTRGHWGDPADQLGQMRKLAAKDKRIKIVEDFVSQPELWRMMKSATCMLSTHRAEGFGYVPAYALALAKPLVTTDYGGPQDFCSARTSFPVAAKLVDVPNGHALYSPEGAKWADVSPEAVAVALRRVYDNPAMAATRARHGQDLLAREYSMTAYAARCRRRLEQIGAL